MRFFIVYIIAYLGTYVNIFGKFLLLEISHAAFKNLLILVSGDVLADVRADTFAVTHFAEDTSVGRGYSLDSLE